MPKSVLFDKDEIMERVTTLFWEKGYHATSMQDLVDATGLNRSSIYNSYGDKYNLFIEALKHYRSQQIDGLSTARNSGLSAKDIITQLFDASWQELNGPSRGCFLSNCATELSNTDQKVKSYLKNNMDEMENIFADLVRQGQEENQINPNKDPKAVARFLFSSLQGLRVTSMIDSNPQNIQSIAKETLSVLD